jgi:pimeloyl-ACP methyl ester carboxylesterase
MASSKPPLPPRQSSAGLTLHTSNSDSDIDQPPRYTELLTPQSSHGYPYSGGLDDPRASSQQSLRPVESAGEHRRTLLLIYIHGFLGDETSFKSFPAHVHNVLTVTLAESHVVHSKIYPRYRSRKNITFARDDFSKWLQPHESPTTDIILIGHSLGGILAAEVVLIPLEKDPMRQFKHRILGQIAFDTPFLGMHPGVVSTGIASLFRSPPDVPNQSEAEASPSDNASTHTAISDLSELSPSDPNYNPTFANDVRLATRSGKLERGWYFFNKHWGELTKASKNYVTSHLEFGGCLMDYVGLRKRYDAIRELEDMDDFSPITKRPRVRFVNYYTASTGRIKERKESPRPKSADHSGNESTLEVPHPASIPSTPGALSSGANSPRISVSEHRNGEVIQKELEEAAADNENQALTSVDPTPMSDSEDPRRSTDGKDFSPTTGEKLATVTTTGSASTVEANMDQSAADLAMLDLTDVGPPPIPPPDFDPSQCHDPGTLKLRQKEHDRATKAYQRALKDREHTIRDRQKLVQKREKAAQKQAQKAQKEELKRTNTVNMEAYDKQLEEEAKDPVQKVVKQKDRKFCTLPAKDQRTGMRDKTWIRVYMEGMDEVVAHTSLFFVSETYAKLVGDTAERVEAWIKQDLTRRAVMEAQQGVD